MPRFFIQKKEISGSIATIKGSDIKHIRSVLRMKPGDMLRLFDETGFSYEAKIVALSSGVIEVSIYRTFSSKAESRLNVVVAQAYLKDRTMDTVIRQVTELGIHEWIPFMAKRSVPRPDQHRLRVRVERWKKIANESLKQCGRYQIPKIPTLQTFDGLLTHKNRYDIKIVFWENETLGINAKCILEKKEAIDSVLIMLGPEGGFTKGEIQHAKEHGFVTASLGPRILKADTATIAACTLVQSIFGDMG
jgi:16S rRNA (uracil1498-N3)-methyltransferase